MAPILFLPQFAKLKAGIRRLGIGAMADARTSSSNQVCSVEDGSGAFEDREAWGEAFESLAKLGFSGIISVLGLGLWMAWIWFALNGSVPLYPDGVSEILPPTVALVSFSITMLVCALSPSAARFMQKRLTLYISAGAACLGCISLALEALGALPAGFEYAAILLCGFGSAVLLFTFGLSYTRLEPGPAIIAFAGSALVCFIAYFCLSGIGDFGEDILFAGLPILCALSLGGDYKEISSRGLDATAATAAKVNPSGKFSTGLKRLFVASSIFFGAISFTHAMAPLEEHGFATDAGIVAMMLIECAIALVYVTHRATFKILKVCYVSSVILFIFANTIAPITGDYYLEYEALRNASYFILFMVIWTLLSWVAGYGEAQPRQVFGIAFAAIGLAMAIGWIAGLLIHQAYGEERGAFSIAVGFAVLAFFSFGFNIRDIPKLVIQSDRKPAALPDENRNSADRSSDATNKSEMIATARRAMVDQIAAERNLSPRESEVFTYLVQGYGGERIAEELCISYHTVRAHVRNIYRKLDVHSREELLDRISAL